MDTLQKYSAVFGRSPIAVRPPNETHVGAAVFPPGKRSFWRGLFSEAVDCTVTITYGLSDHSIPVPPSHADIASDRVELIALSSSPMVGGSTGQEDVLAAILQVIGNYIVKQKIFVTVGHTLDFQEPFGTNIEMSGVLFALPFGLDVKRIMKCSRAREILNVVPLTPAELKFTQTGSVEALLDRFEQAGVHPTFDCFRKSAL